MSTDDRRSEEEQQAASAEAAPESSGPGSRLPEEGRSVSAAGAADRAEEGDLPDWATRQIEALQVSREAEAVGPAGDEEAASASADEVGERLPDWAAQKMAQFQAADGTEAEGDSAHGGSGASVPEAAKAAPDANCAAGVRQAAPNLELMLDLPLDATVELGRAELPLAQVLALTSGSIIQLDRLPGEPLDLLVNGRLVARGEIVVLNDTFAFRITDLVE